MKIYKIASGALFEKLMSSLTNSLKRSRKNVNEEMVEALANDVTNEIDSMGIPYSIENFMAPGMAKTNMLVLGNVLFHSNAPTVLFSIFHELAHFYQYRKYGDDFALSIYTNEMDQIEQDVDKLLEIENTANKFGLMKSQFYLRKYGLTDVGGIDPQFAEGYANRAFVIQHVRQMKTMVEGMEPDQRTIDQINENIYNLFRG